MWKQLLVTESLKHTISIEYGKVYFFLHCNIVCHALCTIFLPTVEACLDNKPINIGGALESCEVADVDYLRCNYTCPDGEGPSIPIPNVYTCGTTGSFNKVNPNEKVRVPPCEGESLLSSTSLLLMFL